MFLLSAGIFPYDEDEKVQNGEKTLLEKLYKEPEAFFAYHKEQNQLLFSPTFKDLFIGMTRTNPAERLTI